MVRARRPVPVVWGTASAVDPLGCGDCGADRGPDASARRRGTGDGAGEEAVAVVAVVVVVGRLI